MKCSARFLSLLSCLFLVSGALAQAPSFDRLDRNSDGKVEKDELPERAQQLFDRLDADSDGSITKDEFETFEKRRSQMQQQRQRQGQRPQVSDVAGVEITRDIPYADENIPRQKLDIAIPEKRSTDKPLPVIVLIHGGGWQGGTHGPYLSRAIPLVRTGDYAAVSIGYRLTDVASWPTQLHDCQAGLRWVKANAEKYNWDPDKIVVWGSSAGGHLVAMLGVSADVAELDGKLGPSADQSLKVAGVIDFFGPANMLTMGDGPGFERHNSPDSPESKLLGGTAKENVDVAKSASPQFQISKDDAPILILHGTKDGTVPFQQSVDFHEALTKAGVDSTFVPVEGAGHGFAGPEVNERVEAFLSKVLLGKDVEVSDEPIKNSQGQQRRPQQRPQQRPRSE